MKIMMDKEKVLSLLALNKRNHIQTYTDALAGWEQEMNDYGQKVADWATQSGELKDKPAEPYKPVNFTKEYDCLIEMIEHHEFPDIELDEYDFDKIVRNKFSWSDHFVNSNSRYTAVR